MDTQSYRTTKHFLSYLILSSQVFILVVSLWRSSVRPRVDLHYTSLYTKKDIYMG